MNKGDIHILEQLKECDVPVFLLVNKIDENPNERVAKTIAEYAEYFKFEEVIPISAINGKMLIKLMNL